MAACFFCGTLMIAHRSFYLPSNFTWLVNVHIQVDVLIDSVTEQTTWKHLK